MRIRMTLEYEYGGDEEGNSKIVAEERQSWLDGACGVDDVIGCDPTAKLSVEVIEDLPIAASQSHGIAAK